MNNMFDDVLEIEEIPIDEDILSYNNEYTLALEKAVGMIGNPHLPMLFLDNNLNITYISEEAYVLFRGYHHLLKKPFFNIFGTIFDHHELRNFLESIRSPNTGFTWKGLITHKIRSQKTLQTQTTVLPVFKQDVLPSGYIMLFDDVSKVYLQRSRMMFTALLEASKLKDNDTGNHSERLNFYSKEMAQYLYQHNLFPQVDKDFIDNIAFLAAMHDIGKIGTPDYILLKPGKLNDFEWQIMQEHTINGALILGSYPDSMAKEIALSHHERWDGSGYPFKLEKEMIPLSARIVGIADVYDALRMKRSYKESYSHEYTVDYIISASGTQFDPQLIDVFKKIHQQFADVWDSLPDTPE